MAAQLAYRVQAQDLPNVTIRVLPFTSGVHPALHGAFAVLEFPDAEDPRVVYIDNLGSSLYVESIREVGLYRLAYQQLQQQALQPDESTQMIVRLMEELRTRAHTARSGAYEYARASWRKASRSGSSANCVETCSLTDGLVAIRDSKNRSGAVLIFTPAEWEAFRHGVRDGAFD